MEDSNDATMFAVTVREKRELARDTFLFELVSADGGAELPAFAAGAHTVVFTPSGLTRRYSLCNAPQERHRYQVAIKREALGMGGSISMVDEVQVGDRLMVSRPENHFALEPLAERFVFIAGGIGITPILSMVRSLCDGARDFRLVYCTRSVDTTAFAQELADPAMSGRCVIHHDQGDPTRAYDLASLLAEPVAGTHVYCCGPGPLMQAVRNLSRQWPSGSVHFEDFGTLPAARPPTKDQSFTVQLARTGRTVAVPAGVTILEALRDQGLVVPSSCESGTCGACRTPLLAGTPEHRDFVLDEDAQDEIMICVSRARSEQLVLDI
jgi:phthalate 4,5-dioxygenase reductase subunit